MPSVVACKRLETLILYANGHDFDTVFVQAATTQLQSEVSDLKNRLEAQETGTQRANSKFEFSVSEQEKLKKALKRRRRPGLMKRWP